MPFIARLDDTGGGGTCLSTGIITSSSSKTIVEGKLVARVGDQYTCILHLVQSITTGSSKYKCEGAAAAIVGSLTSCGAIINSLAPTHATKSTAPV